MGMNDHLSDEAIDRRRLMAGRILAIDLVRELDRRDFTLLRLNFKHRGYDVLVIIEVAQRQGKDQVAFCNAKELDTAVRTVYSLLVQDKLRWRDKKEWN